MRKAKTDNDIMRRDYGSQLKGGVRGKYYGRASAGSNLVLIDPDLIDLFPDSDSVNRALRVLADAAKTVTKSQHARKR